jgi:hypothetical protein
MIYKCVCICRTYDIILQYLLLVEILRPREVQNIHPICNIVLFPDFLIYSAAFTFLLYLSIPAVPSQKTRNCALHDTSSSGIQEIRSCGDDDLWATPTKFVCHSRVQSRFTKDLMIFPSRVDGLRKARGVSANFSLVSASDLSHSSLLNISPWSGSVFSVLVRVILWLRRHFMMTEFHCNFSPRRKVQRAISQPIICGHASGLVLTRKLCTAILAPAEGVNSTAKAGYVKLLQRCKACLAGGAGQVSVSNPRYRLLEGLQSQQTRIWAFRDHSERGPSQAGLQLLLTLPCCMIGG